MKKLFLFALCITLVFSLLCVSTFATGEDITLNTENGVEYEIPGESDAVERENTENGESEGGEQSSPSDNGAFYSKWIDNLTSSTLWVSIGTYAAAALGIIAFVKKKFGDVISLIHGKADAAAVAAEVKNSGKEIIAEYKKSLAAVEEKLSVTEQNEKKLMAILTIFITNANINPNAKTEIMNYLSGIREFNGTVEEIVKSAAEVISAAKSAEEPAKTPALDAIRSDIMKLG